MNKSTMNKTLSNKHLANKARLLIMTLGCVIITGTSAMASGFGYETGIKSRALSGAFRAVADDWSAAANNPAGLAALQDNQFGFGNHFLHNRFSYNVNYQFESSFGSQFETGFANGQEIANQHQTISTPEGGIAVRSPWWGETVIGFSIFESSDQNLAWTLFEGLEGYSSFEFPVDQKQFSINMDIVNFQATFAREFIEDKLSIGLGIALVRADLNFNNIVLRNNPLNPTLVDRPYEKIPEFTSSDGNGWSLSGRLGLMWKAAEKLRVGATFTPKTTITVDGRTAFEIYMPADTQLQKSEGYQRGDDEYYFTSGLTIETSSNFSADVVQPASFGAGIAYDLSDKLTVTMDAEYTLWSQFKGFSLAFNTFDSLNVTLPQGVDNPFPTLNGLVETDLASPAIWDDAGSGMMGLIFSPNSSSSFMGGFRVEQAITSDTRTTAPQFLNNGTIYHGSLGFSIDANRWTLQGVASITKQPDLSFSAPADVNADNINDNVPASISGNTYQSVFGLLYHF